MLRWWDQSRSTRGSARGELLCPRRFPREEVRELQRRLAGFNVFPYGRYGDLVDASSGAFTRLTRYPAQFVPPTSLRLPRVSPICRGIPFEPHVGRRAPLRLRRPESA